MGRHKKELPQTNRSAPFFTTLPYWKLPYSLKLWLAGNQNLVYSTFVYVSVLESAFTHLQGVSGEVLTTKFAPRPALRTCVLEMVLHQNTWYLRPTFIGAGNSIMFACVKMSLSKKPIFSVTTLSQCHGSLARGGIIQWLLSGYPCSPISSLKKQKTIWQLTLFYSKNAVTHLTCWLSSVSYLILLIEPYLTYGWI